MKQNSDHHYFYPTCQKIKYLFFDDYSLCHVGMHGSLMISALFSGSSSPGLSPVLEHCVVFLGKWLSSHSASHSASLHQVMMNLMLGLPCNGLAFKN